MADTDQELPSNATYEEQLRAANEIVYKHSLELARLKQALELANAQQENLLHFISHEIKGYLTKGEAAFAEIADGDYGNIPEPVKKLASDALLEMRKGVATVMDILEAANLKKGTIAFKKLPFDMKASVMKVAEELRPAAYEKRLGFEIELRDGEYGVVGDEQNLREHVIRNLIDNAIRYTPTGTIKVHLTDGDKKIHFSVEDSGVGITPEDMARLFTEGG